MNAQLLSTGQQNRLKDLCDGFADQHVCVVGDLMFDRFMYGAVSRISPESPVPVLALSREENMLGGAGNALANLAGLGVKTSFLSVVGQDEYADQLQGMFDGLDYAQATLIADISRRTTVKTRFLSGHQQLLRADIEDIAPISDQTADKVLSAFQNIVTDCQVVILSDYGKGVLTPDLTAALIACAQSYDVPVFVDPKGSDYSKYRGAFAVTPNKKELSDALGGASLDGDQAVEAAAQSLITGCGIENVFATRSAEGMSVISDQGELYHVRSAQDIEVFDVSGAGDTVIAMLAASIAAGASLEEAAQLGNIAGSVAVTKVGTAPVFIEEIIDVLHGEGAYQPSAGSRQAALTGSSQAIEQVKRWRARGYKIGFTNGCFDIVHAGHTAYLNEARGRCDRLIVGLNSDSSVRVLKGSERPIHDEQARAAVIGALASVDLVILFGAKQEGDDNTACALLDALRPDIYFKGGDYTVDQIPEAPTVHGFGGTVEVLSNIEGYSTTAAIEKIKS